MNSPKPEELHEWMLQLRSDMRELPRKRQRFTEPFYRTLTRLQELQWKEIHQDLAETSPKCSREDCGETARRLEGALGYAHAQIDPELERFVDKDADPKDAWIAFIDFVTGDLYPYKD